MFKKTDIYSSDFPKGFTWGVASSAYQTEGKWNSFGKGLSIWDTFINNSKSSVGEGNEATEFYTRFKEDIKIVKSLGLRAFRFSISWPRIFPMGTGEINDEGVAFYHRVIDYCIECNLEPWVTLYHWDLPQILEDLGGWTNRDILIWFAEYAEFCTKQYGSKVKHWIILNEPMSFTGLGYFTGYHAPGRKGLQNFLQAAHHAALCQAIGGRIARGNVTDAVIGTTFSCSVVKAKNRRRHNREAARRLDVLLNRLFIEPALGLGYPHTNFPALKQIEKYMLPGDRESLSFDFDFIGVQYYFRIVAKFSPFMPYVFAKEIPASKRNVKVNNMGMEVYHKGLYRVLKRYNDYSGIKQIYITEAGICLDDELQNGKVNDKRRIKYIKKSLKYVHKALRNGINVKGVFIWTLVDNFEWAEGFKARFGLVYNDFETQKRTLKKSAYWLQSFLRNKKSFPRK